MQTIGERLAFTRKNILCMNQKNFSELLGISQGALSDAENNNRGLSMEAIITLIRYSKTDNRINCEWILTGEDSESENLEDDEQELVKTYKLLDKRGQHKIHTVIYEEIDRMKSEKNDISSKEFQQKPENIDSISDMAFDNNLVRR